MDKLFMYVEENKQLFRDADYKMIVDCIMENKEYEKRKHLKCKRLYEKLQMMTNDYIRISKAFINLFLEREGYIISNPLPSNSLDMEYEEFSRDN